MRLVLVILHCSVVLRELNLIVLIPKCKAPKTLAEFSLISLCNVTYKVMSKVLVNKLKGVMNYVILKNQSVFLSRRHLIDNTLIALEMRHHVNSLQG